jgi:hypothetical protein
MGAWWVGYHQIPREIIKEMAHIPLEVIAPLVPVMGK